jgi:DNA-binding response OmpR family regulator
MRILFAEDDKQLRASVVRGLREESYAVDQAGTGPQAAALVAANDYDAIILDVLLPGKSGLDVCADIRAVGSRVPILMLTALDAIEHRIAGLDAGADDYLVKPFDFGELTARLRALTRRATDTRPQIQVGDLVIDVAQHTVHRGEREIPLTAKEFAFLLHLARNVGRVVTRAELVEHVWDDTSSYSNVIDVYASRLRHKIDDGERTPMFITLRGVGFILKPPPEKASKRADTPRPVRKST